MAAHCDLLVIGGGINGAGIARDAAGRGLSVLLVEKSDLGARHFLGLVEAHPRRPALPRALRVSPGRRGARRTRGAAARGRAARVADALRHAARAGAAAALDDPRWACSCTTISRGARCCRHRTPVALDAAAVRRRAASPVCATASSIPTAAWTTRASWSPTRSMPGRAARRVLTRTECVSAQRSGEAWRARLSNGEALGARAIVNAAGPWVKAVLNACLGQQAEADDAPGEGQPHRGPAPLRGRACVHPAERRLAAWCS